MSLEPSSPTAVITGAGGTIGRAIARKLSEAGYVVHLVDLAADEVEKTHEVIGDRAVVDVCDVANRHELSKIFERYADATLSLHCLVNAAGIPGRGAIDEVDDDLWERAVAVNLSAVYWACRFALPALRRAGGGTIINIASIAGVREQATSPIYSATKGGVVMFSRSLAAQLAREDLRVFAVCPPPVDTPMLSTLFDSYSDPARAKREYSHAQPTGRLMTPEEVATVVVALACDPPPYSAEPLVV